MSRQPITLAADVEAGLRRLCLAAIRREAPEVLATAKTQRWAPEELLRVLVDAEIASRDASNTCNRMAAARFPIDNLHRVPPRPVLHPRSQPRSPRDPRVDPPRREPLPRRPRRHGRTRYLIGLGRAAVTAGYKVRYFTAIDLVEHLYRAVADHTVGQAIEAVGRNDLIIIDEIGFAPLDHSGCQPLFRLVAAGYERRSIAIGAHSPFNDCG